jgi:hypothetical protein
MTNPRSSESSASPVDAELSDGRAHAQPAEGGRIIQAAWLGTVAFAATSAFAAAVDASALRLVALATALVLFLAGIVAFLAAFTRAVSRSRTDEIGVFNLFFLDHSAPRPVRTSLLGALAVQIAVAIAVAALRPDTSLAFGVLVPIYGLGLAGLWAARHGIFPARTGQAGNPSKTRH